MLRGTDDEFEYHSTRAAEEIAHSNGCSDQASAEAHLVLANLHRSRAELVTALRSARRTGRDDCIYRTDKES